VVTTVGGLRRRHYALAPDKLAMRQSIAHIALVVRDYDEAIRFYTQTLSFTLVKDEYQPAQDKR
jgi:catechol-2,3-dioxygenase